MSNLTIFDFNSNNIRFENREGQVWVCLTDMAKASGKQIGHWNSLSSTTQFLNEFESIIGMTITETVQGGIPHKQGTWAIEEVALEFAGWCSVSFKIWMLQQIKTLLKNGSVSLQPQPPKLPCHVVAVEKSRAIAEIENNLLNHPRLAQFLIDHTISDLMEQKALSGETLRGVVEIAEEMGLPVNIKNRSQLGKFVKSICGDVAIREDRLVNGTMRSVCCYPDNENVREAIKKFFN